MNTKYPGIMYQPDVKNGRYNQHVSSNCLLVEVGDHTTTLEEAKYGAKLLAGVLYEYMKEKGIGAKTDATYARG
jgi:stage II sporulation protein P